MGKSYDAVYFFGCVAESAEGEYTENGGWAMEAATEALAIERRRLIDGGEDDIEDIPGEDDIEDIDVMGVLETRALVAASQRCIERWGCVMVAGQLGTDDYERGYVCPADAIVEAPRWGDVPPWTPEQIAHWRECMERYRADVPGLGEPGLRFGLWVG